MKLREIWSIVAVSVLWTSVALAEGDTGSGGSGGTINIGGLDPLNGATWQKVTAAVLGALTNIAIPIVGIMVVIGGIQLMTAAGNEQRVTAGRKTLTYAAIGAAVVISGKLILQLVTETLQGI